MTKEHQGRKKCGTCGRSIYSRRCGMSNCGNGETIHTMNHGLLCEERRKQGEQCAVYAIMYPYGQNRPRRAKV